MMTLVIKMRMILFQKTLCTSFNSMHWDLDISERIQHCNALPESQSWLLLLARSLPLNIIALHCIAVSCIALIFDPTLNLAPIPTISLPHIVLYCIALHCIALQYITLHWITLPLEVAALHNWLCGTSLVLANSHIRSGCCNAADDDDNGVADVTYIGLEPEQTRLNS